MSDTKSNNGLVIVADGRATTRNAMKAALEERGYQVEAVDNGAMACAAFAEHGGEVVILDTALPGQDGYLCLRCDSPPARRRAYALSS